MSDLENIKSMLRRGNAPFNQQCLDMIQELESRLDLQAKDCVAAIAEAQRLSSRLNAISAATRDWKAGMCSATEAMARIISDSGVEKP